MASESSNPHLEGNQAHLGLFKSHLNSFRFMQTHSSSFELIWVHLSSFKLISAHASLAKFYLDLGVFGRGIPL